MKNKEEIIEVIFSAIDDINEDLPKEQRLEKSLDTPLYDPSGNLDSLGIINFIAALEQRTSEKFGYTITLVNERTMGKASPLKTIGTLAQYMSTLL